MVCSQVSSRHPSHCNVHQHRSWAPSNAEMRCQEPETSKGNWLGNTTPDGHLWSSRGYACSGYAKITSPFKSSWIQRLIPSHDTRVEQPQPLDKPNRDKYAIDGVQTNWKENANDLTVLGNQSVYENSRRSKQEFCSSHQTYLGTNTPACAQNGVNIAATSMQFEASDAVPPEIQVPPKPLPVVESLLPGCSKKVTENQTFTETNMPHILSRCPGFVSPMKQAVHYFANEKSRVSCSSIEGPNPRSVRCADKPLPMGKRCINPSQPFSEFPFSSSDSVTRSNINPTYGGKDRKTCTNFRGHMNLTQKEDPFIDLHTESRYPDLHEGWASPVARCQSVENRLLDEYSMPYRAVGIESFQECVSQKMDERLPLGFSINQLTCPKKISKRNYWNPKERHSHAHDGSQAHYASEGSFDGGWWPIPNMEKDQQISNLASLHCGANVAKEKAGISSSHHMIEQELGSSHVSHEKQGGTSRSFSFHFENQLASELDHAKVVARKGQWLFGPSALSSEVWSEDNRARGLPEATRLGLPLDNSSIFQETGVCEAGTAYIGRSGCSPFFETERLNESASHRISDNYDVSLYKAACINMREMCIGEMNTQALPRSSVDQARQENARSLLGGCKLSRLESNEGMEGMFSLPSRTVSVNNWKACKPSIRSVTHTCPPEGARLNHADGTRVSVNNWNAFKPFIRTSTHTCAPEGARLSHADGNLCYSTGSIGSCSKTPANLIIDEYSSTSVDARSRPTIQEKPAALPLVALQKDLGSSQRQCSSTAVNAAPDDGDSEGKEALGWEGTGLAMKQNIWLQRWSTLRSRKVQAVSMEGGVLAGMTHARNYFEDYSTSQGSRESSYHFDLRPAKRVCYEKRSGLQPELGISISNIGSVAVRREHNEKGVASHFMKRFFTPSAAAMAIMGITARKVHGTQPQRRGLFGVWASNASVRKPSTSHAEACKEFLTRTDYEKEFLQSAAKAPSTLVDL